MEAVKTLARSVLDCLRPGEEAGEEDDEVNNILVLLRSDGHRVLGEFCLLHDVLDTDADVVWTLKQPTYGSTSHRASPEANKSFGKPAGSVAFNWTL
jgi:hypothetical protein